MPFNASPHVHTRGEFYLTDPLAGAEQAIDAQIDRLIALKRDKPVIMVDFGGSLGLSFIRIAAKRRSLVEDGRLVMVVTNLAFAPDFDLEDADGYKGIARLLKTHPQTNYDWYNHRSSPPYYSPDELAFINNNQSLVQYERGDVRELGMQGLQVNGRVISWQSNIDLIHEQKVLIHTGLSDYVLPRLGSWLSDAGVLLVGTDEELFEHGWKSNDQDEIKRRKEAYGRGMDNLSRMVHINRRVIPESTYTIAENPSAPDILGEAA